MPREEVTNGGVAFFTTRGTKENAASHGLRVRPHSNNCYIPLTSMPPNEKSLIARILRALPHRHAALRLGASDDAAVIRGAGQCVVSCDSFLEGIHFLRGARPADSIGYKSLARATSDLAAMGVPLNAPRFFLLTLALPREKCGRWLDEFLRGMRRSVRELGMTLAGGDISIHTEVLISITVIAIARRGALVTRSGARPGDLLYVSGRLGAAQAGLELLLRARGPRGPGSRQMLERHLYPHIRMELGAWLAERRLTSAMIDTSDGFSTDLRNLCDASGVGARVLRDALPVVEAPHVEQRDALRLALDGGDDYELLFTVPARLAGKIPAKHRGVRITRIGQIVRGKKMELVDARGRATTLRARGWDPFRK